VVGVVLGAGSGALVYQSTRGPSPISLIVLDGSTLGVIEGNLPNITSGAALAVNLTATTYANETGNRSSTLVMLLETWTYYDSAAQAVRVWVNLSVSGHFVSNLHPAELLVTSNLTGPDETVSSTFWFPKQVNVSYSPNVYVSFAGNGSATQSVTLVNQGGSAPYYDFVFSELFLATGRYWWNHFFGLRATVTGLGAQVGVGVLLKIVDIPGGAWP